MPLQVYDYRTDLRNILVTPQIRARFMPLGVGQTARGHSHDLGHEVFLILHGQAEFTIDGQSAVLGPGQLCIALTDQVHTVRNVGDQEVIMYLSVTPHILPTHTFWAEDGAQEAPRFSPPSVYDARSDPDATLEDLAARHLHALERWAAAAQQAVEVARRETATLTDSALRDDAEGVSQARDRLWFALRDALLEEYAHAQAWNDLASATAPDPQG